MKIVFYLGLWVTVMCGVGVHAQSYRKSVDQEAYRHHLSFSDYKVSFFTLSADAKMRPAKLGRDYYWLAGSQLNTTNGGYSGKLLHGPFNSFYLNKQLKEQGNFRLGLKEGEWKQWNEQGTLTYRTKYRKGLANGYYYNYDETGRLVAQGNYVSGKLHGTFKKFITPDSVEVTQYRNGVTYQKSARPWWKLWKKRK